MGKKKTDVQEAEQPKLEDFVVMEKVDAFCRAFQPAEEESPAVECFDDSRLREVFQAYIVEVGDPLKIYIQELATRGFHMVMSIVTCEPTIFVTLRT